MNTAVQLQLRHKSCHHGILSRGSSRAGTFLVTKAAQQPGGSPSSTTSSRPAEAPPTADTIVWGGKQPSARRAIIGGLTALGIALGGNLGGISSGLLGLDGGQFAAQLHLDVLVPVRGFKRCVDAGNGFEFQYPAEWLADQTLYRRAVQRAEAARSLDPQPIRRRQREVAEPSAAFGPAGSTWVWACAMLCHGFILLVSILLSTVDSIGKWHGGITCATE
eukprot:GHUV01038065.1.p1 GENE.GHUV01038065.1~~GHUV01038065.1.p1  ORF type:complete len:220 (+),score=47.88 GHUV01038065.1:638-1297(+)